jgi:hypothetical protein
MTPAAIIQQAAEDGVRIVLSPTGTIKATGDQATVSRWLPLIRENKPGILAVLQAANDEHIPNPVMESRGQRVLAMLAERPDTRYAVIVDNPNTDPVRLTLAIRGQATCELAIPAATFDTFRLMDLIDRTRKLTVH